MEYFRNIPSILRCYVGNGKQKNFVNKLCKYKKKLMNYKLFRKLKEDE